MFTEAHLNLWVCILITDELKFYLRSPYFQLAPCRHMLLILRMPSDPSFLLYDFGWEEFKYEVVCSICWRRRSALHYNRYRFEETPHPLCSVKYLRILNSCFDVLCYFFHSADWIGSQNAVHSIKYRHVSTEMNITASRIVRSKSTNRWRFVILLHI
jgi:hypothetical protein